MLEARDRINALEYEAGLFITGNASHDCDVLPWWMLPTNEQPNVACFELSLADESEIPCKQLRWSVSAPAIPGEQLIEKCFHGYHLNGHAVNRPKSPRLRIFAPF